MTDIEDLELKACDGLSVQQMQDTLVQPASEPRVKLGFRVGGFEALGSTAKSKP